MFGLIIVPAALAAVDQRGLHDAWGDAVEPAGRGMAALDRSCSGRGSPYGHTLPAWVGAFMLRLVCLAVRCVCSARKVRAYEVVR